MVALERRPSRWAVRCTASQVLASALAGQICRRTSGSKISAPPPGRLPRPAAMSSSNTAGDRSSGLLGEPGDLDRREGLQVQPRKRLVQAADHAHVPAQRPRRMRAADHVQLGAAGVGRLLAAGQHFLLVEHVSVRVADVAAVGAQRAAIDADVRRVDVGVDVVIDRVAVAAAAGEVGQLADRMEIDLGREEQLPVGRRQPPARFDLGADLIQGCGKDVHSNKSIVPTTSSPMLTTR